MRKDSAVIFGASVLITAAIVGTAYYQVGREGAPHPNVAAPALVAPQPGFGQSPEEADVSAETFRDDKYEVC